MFKREELVQYTTEYAPNHDEVAQTYKKQAEYKCQLCKVECSSNHSLLHLHHKDGDKHNNHHENLSVLCLLCHSEMYKHQHMKVQQYQIEEIRNLRTAQKIPDLSEYSMGNHF